MNIITLAVVVGGYQAYDQYLSTQDVEKSNSKQRYSNRNNYSKTDFRCDGREYCSQMTSREEAEYFTANCPNTKMDGDHDGIPCENDSRW